jgi:hypothetical protein
MPSRRDLSPAELRSVLGELKRGLIGVLNYVQLIINITEDEDGKSNFFHK